MYTIDASVLRFCTSPTFLFQPEITLEGLCKTLNNSIKIDRLLLVIMLNKNVHLTSKEFNLISDLNN